MRPLLLLLALTSCTASVLGDARDNCIAFEASLDGATERCGLPEVVVSHDCSMVLTFELDSDHVLDCRKWVDAQDCKTLADLGSWPSSCYPGAFAP